MSDDDVKLLIDTLTAAVAAGQQVSVPAERVLELHARLLVAKMEAAESARDALAQPEATACPHIRSSGVGDHATHWCALNGPPAAPEPSEAQDAARYRWLRDPKNADRDEWNMFGPYSSPADIDAAIDTALRAAAAARNTNPA